MMLLEYLLVLIGVLCCTAAPAADIPKDHCKDPPTFVDKELQGNWNDEYYAPGKQANYGCYPGFIRRSLIRYVCTSGEWVPLGNMGQCTKKSCGYPGDIEFGSFELKNGEQFVFGVYVEYTCDEGYKLASKHKRRDCTANGWSGYLPHCDAIKCPPVVVDSDVNLISTSYDEEYSVNQVIRFECKNPNKHLRGASDIVCKPDGTWNEEPPKCEDIKCNKPQISHGQVTSDGERFNKDEYIDYTCDLGYRPNRTPRSVCTETGWSPPPVCEEITCRKENVRFGRILASKDYYSFGETVKLECNDGYVIVDKPEDPKRTCTSHGWSPSLQCISKKCDRPDIPNGSFNTYETFPKEVDRYLRYSCNRGYAAKNRKSEEWVQCTQNGWNPEPRCLKTCYIPGADVLNANIQNKPKTEFAMEGETLTFQCAKGYEIGKKLGVMQCRHDGKFSGDKCIKSCKKPKLTDGTYKTDKTDNDVFETGKYLLYECNTGFISGNKRFEGRSECTESGWNPEPVCTEITCEAENANFKFGDVVHFKCENNRTLKGSNSSQCYYYGWGPEKPVCLGRRSQSEEPVIDLERVSNSTCPPPSAPPLATVTDKKNVYRNGDEVTIECGPGYVSFGSSIVRCEDGKWKSSLWCIKKDECKRPSFLENGNIVKETLKPKYFTGDAINYTCNAGYHISGYEQNTCMDEKWLPLPNCIEDPCKKPDPIDHGNVKDDKEDFKHGDKVTFECSGDYTVSGDGTAVCSTGKWMNIPQCVYTSCEQPPEIINAQLRDQIKPKYQTGEKAYYVCNQGYSMSNLGTDYATCENKVWTTLPACRRIGGKCGAPPTVQYGDITGRRQLSYDSGSFVQYQCANYYKIDGNPKIKCEDGEWEKAPICRVPCTVTKIDMEKNNIYLTFRNEDKIYSTHDDTIEFSCKSGYEKPKTNSMRVQCVNGAISLPKCLLPGSCVLQESEMSQRNIIYNQSLEIRNGETIVFECTEGMIAEGKLDAKCNGGILDYPRCEYAPPCTLQVEEMESHNIYYEGSTKQIQSGQTITFTCAEGTIEEEEESLVATCKNGNIKYPKCAVPKPCYLSESILEENHIELDLKEEKAQSKIYQHDEAINVKCRKDFKHPGSLRTVCFNGTWRSRKCFEKSKSSKSLCRIDQQPLDDNLLLLDEKYNDDSYYGVGDTVRFKCKTGHSAPSEPIGTCIKPLKPANADAQLEYPKCT